MKRLAFSTFVLVILLTVPFFASCGQMNSNLMIKCVSNETADGFYARYAYFSGTRTRTLTVKSDEEVEVKVELTTDDGTIKIVIEKDGEDPEYQKTFDTSASFSVKLKDEGKYKITVVGNGHSGSYDIKYVR